MAAVLLVGWSAPDAFLIVMEAEKKSKDLGLSVPSSFARAPSLLCKKIARHRLERKEVAGNSHGAAIKTGKNPRPWRPAMCPQGQRPQGVAVRDNGISRTISNPRSMHRGGRGEQTKQMRANERSGWNVTRVFPFIFFLPLFSNTQTTFYFILLIRSSFN